MEFCANHRKALYRELYDAVKYGKVGDYEVARRMPTELRRWWLEQVAADQKAEADEIERLRKQGR